MSQSRLHHRNRPGPHGPLGRLTHLVAALVLVGAGLGSEALPAQSTGGTPSATDVEVDSTTVKANREALEALFAIWNERDPQALERAFAADFRYEDVPNGVVATTKRDLAAFVERTHSKYPEFSVEIDALEVSATAAAVEWRMTGTHRGEDLTGVPSRVSSFEVRGSSVTRFRNGRIADHRDYYDRETWHRQLQGGSERGCSTDAATAIAAASDRWEDSFRNGDPSGVAAIYSATGTLFPPDGPAIEGRSAIAAYFKALMASGLAEIRIQGGTVSAEGGLAFRTATYTVYGAEKAVFGRGKALEIWRCEEGSWFFSHDLWNQESRRGD